MVREYRVWNGMDVECAGSAESIEVSNARDVETGTELEAVGW